MEMHYGCKNQENLHRLLFSCNKYCALINTPCWHCNKCNFSMCSNCASQRNNFPIELNDKYILNHILEHEISNIRCKNFSIFIKPFHNFRICKYIICDKCYNKHNKVQLKIQLFLVSRALLRWRNAVNLYICYECAA